MPVGRQEQGGCAVGWGGAVQGLQPGSGKEQRHANVPGMLLPDWPWPRAVTVIDAIAWAGRQHLP